MSELLLTAYDGSILGPIAKVLGWVMNGVYSLMEMIGIENVSLSIFIFTILVYSCMFPLTYKQQKFSKLSQKMQPELQAINKKYKDKKDQASMMAMNEETQAVYEKYGVSMMGSCAQMLIQLPLFLALYRVFMNVPAYITSVKGAFLPLVDEIMKIKGFEDKMTTLVTDLRIATFPTVDFTVKDPEVLLNYTVDVLNKLNTTGWDSLRTAFPALTDTINASYEVVSDINSFFVFNISDTPWNIITTNFTERNFLMILGALLIPVVSYLTQMLNIKLMPQASGGNDQNDAMAQQMKMVNRMMPLFSLFICFTVPVGLGFYWIVSALVRVVQQFFLNKHFEKIDLEDIIKKNQEKAKKRREKMGISENQISNAARMNTRQMVDAKKNQLTTAEKEAEIEKANELKTNAKAGSMTAKANMVREFNERNNKK